MSPTAPPGVSPIQSSGVAQGSALAPSGTAGAISAVPPPPDPVAAAASPASAPVSNARQGVLMIGDSMMVGTDKPFREAMAGENVEVNAKGGISLKEGMRRYRETADKPRVVEMGLFTNNAPNQIEELRSAIQETIDDARARGGRVVWATIVRPPVNGQNYDAVNDMIRQFQRDNSDVMGVVDWAQMVADNPSYLAGDKIHGTGAGYKARAEAFAAEARK